MYYDAHARAGLVLDLSGWDGESELTLDYLSRRNTSYYHTEYALSVSGSGEADTWTSVLTNMEPVSETTEHHVVDLGAALEAAGITPDGDVYVQWRFRLDHGEQTFGLDRVRVGSQDGMGASVSSLTANRDDADRVTGLTVTFDEVMDAGQFTADDVSVVSPLGTSVPLSGDPVDGGGGRTFTITFSQPQALSGTYPVTIGPEVLDAAGNRMNQDRDARNVDGFSGQFEISIPLSPARYPYFESFDDISLFAPHWYFHSTDNGRIQLIDESGDAVLRMDSSGYAATNAAVFSIDLSGKSDVALYFQEYNPGDESHSEDGVFISDDQGDTWYRVGDLSDKGSQWVSRSMDLDAAISAAEMAYTDDFWIKLQHYEDSYWGGDGREFDDIRVTWEGDGPAIVQHSPTSVFEAPFSLEEITLQFDEDIQSGGFTVDDVTSFTGPHGDLLDEIMNVTGDAATWTVHFNSQTALGMYTLTVGPTVRDLAANPMDQDGDGIVGETADDLYTARVRIVQPAAVPYAEGFSDGLPDVSWEFYSSGNGRVQVAGEELRMDSTDGAALNEAILHLDLADASQITFTLDHRSSGDEYHDDGLSVGDTFAEPHRNADIIAISDDGESWYVLHLLAANGYLEFDLDAAIAAAGMSYTQDFQIKLQQYDDYAWGTDGRAFDNIQVTPAVAGRHIFYNNSQFDDYTLAATVRDDNAVASDKHALLPGVRGDFSNYTSYSRGINGIMIDVLELADDVTLTAADFQFRVGNDQSPETWPLGPSPSSITVRDSAGVNGADRITLIWPDSQIQCQWLQVTALSNANGGHLGLVKDDVFYFGNAIGETGNSPFDALVDQDDVDGIVTNATGDAELASQYDVDRDGDVDGADATLASNHVTSPETRLVLLGQDTPPAVTGVYVSAAAWKPVFWDWMQAHGMTDVDGYYRIPTGSDQLRTLPWSGLSDVRLAFNKDVRVQKEDLLLVGADAGEVPPSEFAYDADKFTGTWNFPTLEADKFLLSLSDAASATASGVPLDGEYEEGHGQSATGNSVPGGDFQFQFHVLPGDATDSGNVVASDVSVLASAFGSFASGSGDRYSVFVDYDGSGNVVAADVSILASHFGQFLPSGEPTVPVSQATSTTMSTASSTSVSESVSLPPAPTAAATTSDTVETTSPATTVPDDLDSDAAAESVSPETDERVLGPVRPAPPVPGTPAALDGPVEVHDAVHVQPTAPEIADEVAEPWERPRVPSPVDVTGSFSDGMGESLVLRDEPADMFRQSSRAVHGSEDDHMAPGSCVSDVAISCALPIPSVSDADRRSLALDRDERFPGEPMADSLAGTVGVDELLSGVEPPVPGLYEPSMRSAAIDAISRDLESGGRSDTPLAAVSIDQVADGELSNNVKDEEDDIDRWSEAVDAVLALDVMF